MRRLRSVHLGLSTVLGAGLVAALPGAAPAGAQPAADVRPAMAAASASVTGTIARGLDTPWGIAFLPDGSALVSSRDDGTITRIPSGGGAPRRVGSVPGSVHD